MIELMRIKLMQLDGCRLPYRKGTIRFMALLLLSLSVVGQNYSFDIPQATEQAYKDALSIDNYHFDMLYTWYALPCVLTTLVLGALMDIIGLRLGVLLMALMLCAGQFVVYLGTFWRQFWIVMVGRIVAGVAAESLMTGQTALVCYWFEGRELALAVGISNTLPQLGDILNSYLTPLIFISSQAIPLCEFFGLIVCLISAGFALLMFWLDRRADQHDLNNKLHQQAVIDSRPPSFKDLRQLPLAFWITMTCLALTVGGYIPFMDNANSYFQLRFCFTNVEAGRATMISYLTSMCLAWPLGATIDRTGRRRAWILITTLMLFSAHFYMLAYPNCDGQPQYGGVIGLFLMGVSFALYTTALLPCPSKMVDNRLLGTAYGLEAMISALVMGVMPAFASLIQDSNSKQAGMRYSSVMFTMMALVNCGIAASLFRIDRVHTDMLDHSESDENTTQNAQLLDESRMRQLELKVL